MVKRNALRNAGQRADVSESFWAGVSGIDSAGYFDCALTGVVAVVKRTGNNGILELSDKSS
jgi:hypothetical protein